MANKKPKRVKLTPTESGGQIYMSDSYAKEYNDAIKNLKNTDLDNLIKEKLRKKMYAEGATPQEVGRKKADITIDQIDESVRVLIKKNKTKPRAFNNGGAVMKGRGPKFKGQS